MSILCTSGIVGHDPLHLRHRWSRPSAPRASAAIHCTSGLTFLLATHCTSGLGAAILCASGFITAILLASGIIVAILCASGIIHDPWGLAFIIAFADDIFTVVVVASAAGFVAVVAFAVVAFAASSVAVVAFAIVAFAASFIAVVAVAFAGVPLERGGSLLE